jgi:hypothetical protein
MMSVKVKDYNPALGYVISAPNDDLVPSGRQRKEPVGTLQTARAQQPAGKRLLLMQWLICVSIKLLQERLWSR